MIHIQAEAHIKEKPSQGEAVDLQGVTLSWNWDLLCRWLCFRSSTTTCSKEQEFQTKRGQAFVVIQDKLTFLNGRDRQLSIFDSVQNSDQVSMLLRGSRCVQPTAKPTCVWRVPFCVFVVRPCCEVVIRFLLMMIIAFDTSKCLPTYTLCPMISERIIFIYYSFLYCLYRFVSSGSIYTWNECFI